MVADGREVAITHPERVLFEKSHITKNDLIEYYLHIAPYMVPLVKGHPLMLERYPEGIKQEGFYQKNASSYFPSWIARVKIPKKEGGSVHHVIANNAATLVYLANQATIAFHMWTSRADKIHYPDRIVFDIDPSVDDFGLVRKTALALRTILEHLGLTPFVMTTGSRGLHVTVPLKRTATYDQVEEFAAGVGRFMCAMYKDSITMEIRKASRKGKIFMDVLRNSWTATAIAPYAVRPKEGAPVATPLYWYEVEGGSLTPTQYTIENIFKRLQKKEDPWAAFYTYAKTLTTARKRLATLLKAL